MARSSVFTSTIGLKVAMAVSGVVLIGFVAQHMIANLQVFAGRDVFNAYAHFMQGLGGALWVARLGLLGLLILHVGAAIALTRRNLAARPQRYAGLRTQRTSPMAKTMMLSGVVVLAYLGYHLAHFTLGIAHPEHFNGIDELGRKDVYTNFVLSFQVPGIAITYVLANWAVAAHISHATTSMFRTLGLSQGRLKRPFALLGPGLGAAIAIGNTMIPLACLLGVVTV